MPENGMLALLWLRSMFPCPPTLPPHARVPPSPLTDNIHEENADVTVAARKVTHALRNHVQAIHTDELDDVAREDGGHH